MSINERLQKNKIALPLIIVYCVSNALLIVFKKKLEAWGVDQSVVIVGNLILFVVSIVSLFLYQRAIAHANTTGFLRNTYSGLFFKLLVCIFAVFVYAFTVREQLNKPALVACIFLYFLYALLEMRSLMQWNKARRNA